MVRILCRSAQGVVTESSDSGQIQPLVADKANVIWVDLSDPGEAIQADVDDVLRRIFSFHPLAVDDALVETHVPKVDDWGDYLYIVLHAVNFQHSLNELETQEVDIFVGPNYLVTHHTTEINALERQWQATLRDERHTRRGVDYLLYELCDAIAADYMPCMDRMEDVIDELEDRVFAGSNPRTVQAIFKLKSAVLALRRVLSPQREVLNKLARGDFAVIDQRDRIYFRDVYDHFVRLADLNESLRDLTSGALDTYLSVTANRTNDIVKALTILSVLFMPLTFITGFFGMNFFGSSIDLVFGANPWLFFAIAMLIMASVPLAMLMYIRHRGWW
jgi:magnesium transporter